MKRANIGICVCLVMIAVSVVGLAMPDADEPNEPLLKLDYTDQRLAALEAQIARLTKPKPISYTQPRDVYTSPLNANDRIYKGLTITRGQLEEYGNTERTLLIYNISLNRLRIGSLEAQLAVLQPVTDVNDE